MLSFYYKIVLFKNIFSYFRVHEVFMSANHLMNQTNVIMRTVKDAC